MVTSNGDSGKHIYILCTSNGENVNKITDNYRNTGMQVTITIREWNHKNKVIHIIVHVHFKAYYTRPPLFEV